MKGVSLQCDNDDRKQCQLQFGEKAPSFGTGFITNSRGISSTLLNPLGVKSCVLKIQVFYDLVIERKYSTTCFSSQSTTLALPQIQYRQGNNNWTTVKNRKEILITFTNFLIITIHKELLFTVTYCIANIAMIVHR